jgi:hypothetical protein
MPSAGFLHLQVEENLRDLETKGDIRAGQYRPTSGDQLLEAIEQISVVWPEGPRSDCLHVFVGLKKRAGSPSLGGEYLMCLNTCLFTFLLPSLVDQRPSKKRRFEDPLEKEFTSFWNILWNENVDLIHRVAVVRDSDPVEDEDLTIPPTIRVLQGLPKILSCGDILIRDQYDDACKDLESSCAKLSAVIITGHPGIGEMKFLCLPLGVIGTHITIQARLCSCITYWLSVFATNSRRSFSSPRTLSSSSTTMESHCYPQVMRTPRPPKGHGPWLT